MRFVVSSSSLLSHLQLISRVINPKSTLPILENFLLKLEGNMLYITASDLETTLITSLEVNEASEGVVAVSAKMMLESLKELPEQPISIDINENTKEITIWYQNGKFNFMGMSGLEYPQVPAIKESAVCLSVDAAVLFTGISKTIFAAADDELRPVMNGVFFDIHLDKITFVASNAHRLVRYINHTVKAPSEASFILPKKPANLLKTILPKETGLVEVVFDDKNARFVLPNYTMICRLVEGRFPDYNRVIPEDNPYKITIERQLLINSLKRVSVFSNQASNLVKLQMNIDKMEISAQDIDFAVSANESVACLYNADPMKIGFKGSFLIDLLANINSEEVVVALADPSRPGVILPVGENPEESLLMLLMPMMLND